MLTLFEELFLLAIDDDRGVLFSSKSIKFNAGLAGAILDELVLQGKVRLNDKQRIEVQDPALLDDEILNTALKYIQEADHPRKIEYWVINLSDHRKKFRKQIVEHLIDRGILIRKDQQIRWIIPSPIYPELKGSAKFMIKDRLRAIALIQGDWDVRSLALFSLVQASGLLKLVFTKDERRNSRIRNNNAMVAEALRNPAGNAIAEIARAITKNG